MHIKPFNYKESVNKTHGSPSFQVVLGPEAKEGEANVVELEVEGYNNKKTRIPICVSKAGGSYVSNVEVRGREGVCVCCRL